MAAVNNEDEGQINEDNQPKAKEAKIGGGRKRSVVWQHFTKIENSPKPRAACNYCNTDYACDPRLNGTKLMLTHLESQCKKYPFRNVGKTQTTLGFKPINDEKGESKGNEVVAISFSAESCRKALAEMLIIDELPFNFVEGEGFRRFMLIACPKWTKIPSRTTITRDCWALFEGEKKKLKSALKGQRLCLTTDTWTSVQNLNYMCLTGHFIDSDWNLHKRILNFCLVESHKGETLGKAIEGCLLEWGIDKILTMTVDNASSNNGVIQFLKRRTKNRKGTILEHEFLHVRCCAHILNLIVREGLKQIDESILKVRNAVRYVRSSPQRWKSFKTCAEKAKIECKSQVFLDVPTRWNFTYLMLEKAEKYQRAFELLEEDDLHFLTSVREVVQNEEDDNGVTRRYLGPPDGEDWDKVRLFVKFLKLFYDATLRFLGSNYVTCNSFFMELMLIQNIINKECKVGTLFLKSMAEDMKLKFEKYWGNFENMNMLLYVGLILDPRYKLHYVSYCFQTLYDDERAKFLIEKVKNVFTCLYNSYVENDVSSSGDEQKKCQSTEEMGGNENQNERDLMVTQFWKHLEEKDSMDNKSDLEKYLAEGCEKILDKFDILAWWKINSHRYPILSKVTRDVLAIPVSTVVSESAFSTGGRVLDSFHSSLSPSMVEALICAQDWLRSSSSIISLRDAMDVVKEYEKFQSDFREGYTLDSSSSSTVTIDDMKDD